MPQSLIDLMVETSYGDEDAGGNGSGADFADAITDGLRYWAVDTMSGQKYS